MPEERLFPISAVTGRGVREAVAAVRRVLDDLGPQEVQPETEALNLTEVPKRFAPEVRQMGGGAGTGGGGGGGGGGAEPQPHCHPTSTGREEPLVGVCPVEDRCKELLGGGSCKPGHTTLWCM